MDDKQNKWSKKISEKLLNGEVITKRDFEYLKNNPQKFKNIKFVKKCEV